MKLAILADIHGNLPALHAVAEHIAQWQPDQVIVNGDIVNRGPCSLAAWQFVQARAAQDGWLLLKGNHEDYLLERLAGNDVREGVEFELNYLSYWTFLQMGTAVSQLTTLQDGHSIFTPDGQELRLRHAAMQHNRQWFGPYTADEVLRPLIAPPPAVFVTSHIHMPYLRQLDNTRIVNTGAAGSAIDGDVRASYIQLFWFHNAWHISFIRLDYDREAMDKQCRTTGFLTETGPISWLIYYEWKLAIDFVYPWQFQFQQDVLQGKVDLKTAVSHYLHKLGLPIP